MITHIIDLRQQYAGLKRKNITGIDLLRRSDFSEVCPPIVLRELLEMCYAIVVSTNSRVFPPFGRFHIATQTL